jgi:hypothetical protein
MKTLQIAIALVTLGVPSTYACTLTFSDPDTLMARDSQTTLNASPLKVSNDDVTGSVMRPSSSINGSAPDQVPADADNSATDQNESLALALKMMALSH